MTKPYVTEEQATVRILHEYTPVCRRCGVVIADPDDAERVRRTFRLQHRAPCEPPTQEPAA